MDMSARIWRRLTARLGGRSPESAAPTAVLAEADAARKAGRWTQAAVLYQQHTFLRPRRIGSHIQLGNMRKQAGDLVGAEAAYKAALAIRPTIEAWLQLGHLLLSAGRADEAIKAFQEAMVIVPNSPGARAGIIDAGARALISRGLVDVESLVRIDELIRSLGSAATAAAEAAIVPLAFYDAFRHAHPLPSPPLSDGDPGDVLITVLIEARGTAPNRLRATLLSLFNQSFQSWTAVVQTDAVQGDHPVSALAAMDSRVHIVTTGIADLETLTVGVTLTAGVVLEVEALAWLGFAMQATAAEAIFGDHDRLTETWPGGNRFSDPAFQSVPDPDELSTNPTPPVVILWRGDAWNAVRSGMGSDEAVEKQLIISAGQGRAAHVPLVLASVLSLSPAAANGLPAPDEMGLNYLQPGPRTRLYAAPAFGEPAPVRVIIPTRNAANLLSACIDSLLSHATHPDRVRITVVDNRSHETETVAFLSKGETGGRFQVLRVDEPFNWSRINNLAVAASTEDRLLFLNNDTEMLTAGWDETLSAALDRLEIGAVGARLLYPDGSLQHAGIVMGLGLGAPRHEGVGTPGAAGGPMNRWRRSRATSAVTGAFLATRRETFDAIGGFDEVQFAVGYNDVDFCLACRARGQRVLMQADIELVHYESRSRGHNDTCARIAWDVGELMSLRRKWGAALDHDPAVNPHWATVSSRPFDGIRGVSRDEAVAWLLSSSKDAWTPRA